MKGIVYTKPGSPDVLKIKDVKKPVPKAKQTLIKVKASAITNLEYTRFVTPIKNGKTSILMRLMDLALRANGRVLGTEVSGIVEEVGNGVTSVKKGDEVFGLTVGMLGAWAEYALANESEICLKPSNLSFEQAAALPVGCITALCAVRTANIKANQSVMVYGASGGVGQFAVQISKAYGATVTAVCSTRNLDMARSIGADYVIDYKSENILDSKIKYDAIIAVNGYNPLSTYKKLLNKGGVYVFIGGNSKAMLGVLFGIFAFLGSSKKFKAATYVLQPKRKSLSVIKEFAENKQVCPFIDNVYSPGDIAQAIGYIVKEHAQGKIVINIDDMKILPKPWIDTLLYV